MSAAPIPQTGQTGERDPSQVLGHVEDSYTWRCAGAELPCKGGISFCSPETTQTPEEQEVSGKLSVITL